MNRRIRVTQLICGLDIGQHNGGGELFGIRLAQALDPSQFEVSICALWSYDTPVERDWQSRLLSQGIAVHFCAPFHPVLRIGVSRSFLAARRWLQQLQPDILNTHVEFADFVGTALRLTGAAYRMVRTAHNVIEWPYATHIDPITRLLYPLVSHAEVGVSRAVVDLLQKRPIAQALHKTAYYIPNAIDPTIISSQRTERDMRALLGFTPETPLFGVVGRLSEQKGITYLITAMREIRQALPNAQLLIVGDGEQRDVLQEQAHAIGLASCTTFLGPRSDIADLMTALDLFVSPSLWEGLPTVLMEAMYLGTPVIATDIPGSRDLVIAGETGRLAASSDSHALADTVIQAYQGPEETQRLALQARHHVAQFTIQEVALTYGKLYQQIYATMR